MALMKLRGTTKRSGSGAKYLEYRKAKLRDLASNPVFTKLEPKKIRDVRVAGGNIKRQLLSSNTVNVYNPKTKKYSVEQIQTVAENPANAQLVRRNILIKGAIIQTPKGKARITSRPGQDGVLNAVLVE
jgi:small subunit ribosomal protein S8e